MAVVGIIAEYNPLHQGHFFHFKQTLKITDAAYCILILSSNFVQRGEPAIFNKWARTQMALNIGADLILELPSAFSCASAEYFASGAINILDSLNCVDYLCFGSEEGKIEDLEITAEYLTNESSDFKDQLRLELDQGLSFAAARQKALISCKNAPNRVSSVLGKPNNILSVEYIKAIKRLKSNIKPMTILRMGQGYNSSECAQSYSSATAVRKHLLRAIIDKHDLYSDIFLNNNLPVSSIDIMSREIVQGRGPVFNEAFKNVILHLFRQAPLKKIQALPYVSEGLENRIKDAAIRSVTLSEFISNVVTNRYPASRIRRILSCMLTGMSGEFLEELKHNGYSQYIRVLGFNEKGRNLLNRIKKKAGLPIITKPANFAKLSNPLARRLFEHEIRTTDCYVLSYPDVKQRVGGSEYKTQPIYLKEQR